MVSGAGKPFGTCYMVSTGEQSLVRGMHVKAVSRLYIHQTQWPTMTDFRYTSDGRPKLVFF